MKLLEELRAVFSKLSALEPVLVSLHAQKAPEMTSQNLRAAVAEARKSNVDIARKVDHVVVNRLLAESVATGDWQGCAGILKATNEGQTQGQACEATELCGLELDKDTAVQMQGSLISGQIAALCRTTGEPDVLEAAMQKLCSFVEAIFCKDILIDHPLSLKGELENVQKLVQLLRMDATCKDILDLADTERARDQIVMGKALNLYKPLNLFMTGAHFMTSVGNICKRVTADTQYKLLLCEAIQLMGKLSEIKGSDLLQKPAQGPPGFFAGNIGYVD
jgi:hypothetical protein